MQYHDESSMKGAPIEALRAMGGAEMADMVAGMLKSSNRDPILVVGS